MKGILRFDDPANLVYAATGMEILHPFINGTFKHLILKWGAESYAAKDQLPNPLKNLPAWIPLILGAVQAAKTLLPKNLDVPLFDNAHDLAVIKWAYEFYANPSLLSLDDFRKTLKYLSKE
ncbi:MAG: hypothetical protein ACRCVN_06140 [Spirochaetia bacterium]